MPQVSALEHQLSAERLKARMLLNVEAAMAALSATAAVKHSHLSADGTSPSHAPGGRSALTHGSAAGAEDDPKPDEPDAMRSSSGEDRAGRAAE